MPLPANRYGGELIFPGQIIVRQRGTRFRPGYNVDIGRDHTLFATSAGFVRFTDEKVMSASGDKLIKERKRVSVVPVNGDWSPAYKAVEQEMVERRARIKRQMMQGRVFEPALFFPQVAKQQQQLPFAASLPVSTAVEAFTAAQRVKMTKASKNAKQA
jgi:ribosomal protein L27